jgi:hypothetical protein
VQYAYDAENKLECIAVRMNPAVFASPPSSACTLIAALGTGVAFLGDSLIGILLIGYTIWVPSLLAPFAWVLLNSRTKLTAIAFWSAVLAGAAGWATFEYLVETPIPGILAGFLANLVVLLLVQGVTSRSAERRSI